MLPPELAAAGFAELGERENHRRPKFKIMHNVESGNGAATFPQGSISKTVPLRPEVHGPKGFAQTRAPICGQRSKHATIVKR